jgi:hypothetical protein
MIFQWWTRIIAPAADHRQSSVHLQNGTLAKWHTGKMARWQNGTPAKRIAGKMDCGRTRITHPAQGQPRDVLLALRGLGCSRVGWDGCLTRNDAPDQSADQPVPALNALNVISV